MVANDNIIPEWFNTFVLIQKPLINKCFVLFISNNITENVKKIVMLRSKDFRFYALPLVTLVICMFHSFSFSSALS
jgi:hypothetical protein